MLGWPWSRETAEVIEVSVFGMACRHCASTVETALADVDGVQSVEVDRHDNRARVRARSTVTVGDLVAAVRSVGYEARPS